MSIQNLEKIIKQRTQQFGSVLEEEKQEDLILQAISALAENQKLLYKRFEELEQTILDNLKKE